MSFLTANATYDACEVAVKQRIIPFGKKAGKDIYVGGKLIISKGGKFKADKYFLGNKPGSVTIHNTEDIKQATGTTKAEQYSRSMYPNENLGDVRVHYFVDEVEAWQNLIDYEVGWHAGSTANATSVSIEIIGSNSKAEDNGARLAAFLLHKYGLSIDKLTTHKAWTGKNCPAYILPHWDSFVSKVKDYLSSYSIKPQVQITAVKTETITKTVDATTVTATVAELQKQGYTIKSTASISAATQPTEQTSQQKLMYNATLRAAPDNNSTQLDKIYANTVVSVYTGTETKDGELVYVKIKYGTVIGYIIKSAFGT